MAQSTIPPAIQNVVKRSSPTNTIVTPVTARSTYAGLANQSSSRLMPFRTNDCVGTGSRATRASHTPYVALNPTAMIANRTCRNFSKTNNDIATQFRIRAPGSLSPRCRRNRGPRYPARVFGGEEYDDGGDLGGSRPSRRIRFGHRGAVLGVVDDPRQDAVR